MCFAWWVSGCPHTYVCPIHSYVQRGSDAPHMSPYSYASVCSERHLHVVGVVEDPLHVGTPPYMLETSPIWWMSPLKSYPPLIGWIPCASMFSGYLHVIWGILPLCWGFGENSIMLGFGGISISVKLWCLAVYPLGVHYALSCTVLVAHYVSHIYHSYDYYSSGYSGVFWSVIYFISDHAPLMGLPAMLGQHEVVLSPPLMQKCLGGVIGLASVPQQQPPSLMPLLAYANYAMGSPQVGFFYRVGLHTFLYIICLVSILVSALCFQVPSWLPYYPMGAQPLGCAPLQPFGVYPWPAYVQPDDGHRSMPGMHRVAAPSTTLRRGSLLLLGLLFPDHPIYMVGHTALRAWKRVTQSLCLSYMMGRVFFSRFGAIR